MDTLEISVTDKRRIDEIARALTEQREKIQEALVTFNDAVNTARAKLDEELHIFNDRKQEAFNLIADIHQEQVERYEAKSEEWLDGEDGEKAYEWLIELEEMRDALEPESQGAATEPLTVEELLDEYDGVDLSMQLINLPNCPDDLDETA